MEWLPADDLMGIYSDDLGIPMYTERSSFWSATPSTTPAVDSG
jgi:hypothetical protein